MILLVNINLLYVIIVRYSMWYKRDMVHVIVIVRRDVKLHLRVRLLIWILRNIIIRVVEECLFVSEGVFLTGLFNYLWAW
jgi:hypothetical protein